MVRYSACDVDNISVIACPCCRQEVEAPALDDLVRGLLDRPGGLSEAAEAVLRAIWEARGLPVAAASLFDAMWADDPDGGRSDGTGYKQLARLIAELETVLAGSGVAVARQFKRRRHCYRLTLAGRGTEL